MCVVSSTDSELKSWHTERGVCLRTYRGHINDKNFVGLSVTPDFIACGMYVLVNFIIHVHDALHMMLCTGSENNAVFVYSKQVSSPMLTYQYNSARGILVSTVSVSITVPSVHVCCCLHTYMYIVNLVLYTGFLCH